MAPLVLEIARRYEKLHPGVLVDVQSGGSSKGVADAREGSTAFGMVSRSLYSNEKDLKPYLIGIDGVAMIAHKSNPVNGLSKAQIIDIYTGKIKNWKAVGGPDKPIVVINKAEGRSTLELFLHHFDLKASAVKAQAVIGENEQGIKMVSQNPNAIGYVSIGTSEAAVKNGVSIKLLKMDGIEPSTENVQNGTFPITRDLNLVVKGKPDSNVLKFIQYAQSSAVKDLVEGEYFVAPGQNTKKK